ncbi:MAG: UvrD-helicase domain-containing protein [Spirochaeta sp.]|jgi:ATP-dependent helicase/nuclease subunit A|nr:UvrD-helicase domain-containing protein [Spirochaeta sp.]
MKQTGNLLATIELISASAGSGKTYRLTERIVEAVRSGVPPERIMATTFTVKAAAELRRRVRETLTGAGYPALGARVADAYIGTVHSLCFRLLKEYAIDAGISPAVEVLPEGDADRIFNIAVATAVERAADTMEPPARRMGRTGRGAGYATERDWRDDVREIVGAARANGMSATDLRTQAAAAVALWKETVSTGGTPPTTTGLVTAATAAVQQLEAIPTPLKGTQQVTDTLRNFLADAAGGRPVPWKTWVELAGTEPKKDAAGILDTLHRVARSVCEVPEFLSDFQTVVTGVYDCAAAALDQFTEYKRERGLTDYDDLETSLLRLLVDRDDVKQGIRERIDIVMVDEFQDTSPMQLALFLELHRVVGRSVWVGDPKQAIYGFRGTDPSLMTRVAHLLQSTETLSRSWRSRQAILDITNAIFTQALYDTPKETVELSLPEERKTTGAGGHASAWYLDSGKKEDDAKAIAAGVNGFLTRHPDRQPRDIAILCRSNNHCAEVAEALKEQGIRASVSAGLLSQTREAQIILAGVRFLADARDTLALTELMVLLTREDRLVPELITAPDETLAAWREHPIPAELTRIGRWGDQLSIGEAVDAVIAASDLMHAVSRWNRPDVRRANVEALRGLAVEYEELQRAARAPASLHGFVAYVGDGETGQAQGTGPDSCIVTTYHGAKGLEWPVVVLAELDKTYDGTLFGVHIVAAEQFDPEHPLAGRRIHYWPWPFGSKKKFPHLEELLAATPLQQQVRSSQHDESVRLLYVGSTRARDHLVFALRNRSSHSLARPGDAWLQRLTDRVGTPLIRWPAIEGAVQLAIGTDTVSVDIAVQTPGYGADDTGGQGGGLRIAPIFQPVRTDRAHIRRIPRSIVPSRGADAATDATAATAATYRAGEPATVGSPIVVPGAPSGEDPDATALGIAIHAVFAAAPAHRIPGKAEDILRRWDVGRETARVIAAPIARAVDALEAVLQRRHSVSAWHREWPVYSRHETGQEMHGWIDLIADTPDGWVIVDHKTYRGPDPSSTAAHYGAQLSHYRQAVERATGKPVLETLINFVLLGAVYKVEEV